MINENVNIDIFDTWAFKDKDKCMESGHTPSVNAMLNIVSNRTNIFHSIASTTNILIWIIS